MANGGEEFSRSEPAPAWRYRIRWAERVMDAHGRSWRAGRGRVLTREGELHAHTQLRAMWLLALLVQRRWVTAPTEGMPLDYQVWPTE